MIKSYKKLNAKQINLYKVLKKLRDVYKLKLSIFIKIYLVFYIIILFRNLINLLSKQSYFISSLIIIKKDVNIKQKVENIINIKRVDKRLKIRVQ